MICSIRKQENLKEIPIILLTAKADEETRISGTEGGADNYLAKPFNKSGAFIWSPKFDQEGKWATVIELNNAISQYGVFLPPAMVLRQQGVN